MLPLEAYVSVDDRDIDGQCDDGLLRSNGGARLIDVTVGQVYAPFSVRFNHPYTRSIRFINERVRARFIVNFDHVNFSRRPPLQGISHVSRPYASRRAIARLHDVALLVLCDPHQYLPSFAVLLLLAAHICILTWRHRGNFLPLCRCNTASLIY